MHDIGTCDLCNETIPLTLGYVFYSATIAPRSKEETGLMHICDTCTDKWINDQKFKAPLEIQSQLKAEDIKNDFAGAYEWLQRGNAMGIIAICKAHQLSAQQARDKARMFAEKLWTDPLQATQQAKGFWNSYETKTPLGPGFSPKIDLSGAVLPKKEKVSFKPKITSTSDHRPQKKQPKADPGDTAALAIIMGISMIGMGILGGWGFYEWLEEDWAAFLGFLIGAFIGILIGSIIIAFFPFLIDTTEETNHKKPVPKRKLPG